jgi:hypothetical protein
MVIAIIQYNGQNRIEKTDRYKESLLYKATTMADWIVAAVLGALLNYATTV